MSYLGIRDGQTILVGETGRRFTGRPSSAGKLVKARNNVSDKESPFDVGRRQGRAGKAVKKSPYPDGSIQHLRWLSGWRKGNEERIETEKAAQVLVFDEVGAVEDEAVEVAPLLVGWAQESLFVEVHA